MSTYSWKATENNMGVSTNLSHLIVHQAQNIFILALASLSAVRKLCELYLVEDTKSADRKKHPQYG